jgi:hypothetical protein
VAPLEVAPVSVRFYDEGPFGPRSFIHRTQDEVRNDAATAAEHIVRNLLPGQRVTIERREERSADGATFTFTFRPWDVR